MHKFNIYINKLLLNKSQRIWGLLLAGMSFSSPIFGGGFHVNLMGIKQIGMGHTGTALKLDASAVYFNPGMMSFLENKYSFSGGVSGIAATAAYKSSDGSYTATTNNAISTPFNAYASVKINKMISAGLAVYTPFGSAVKWDDNWRGRNLIQNISLQAIYFQPTVSVKLTDQIGIGVGLIYATGKVDINRALPLGGNSNVNLSGSTSSWGFQAGLYLQPTDKLSIGATYRSQVTMQIKDGDANFQVPQTLSSNFPAGNKFSAKLPLPASANIGLGYQFTDKLLVGLDFSYIFWNTYDSLIFDFKTNTSSLQDSRNARKYNNAYIARLGAQYKVSDNFFVRAGGYFDKSPVKDDYYNPETPDADRIGLSCGLSYSIALGKPKESTAETTGKSTSNRLSIDVSFLYTHGLERTSSYSPANFGGNYRVNAYIPGVGLSYSF